MFWASDTMTSPSGSFAPVSATCAVGPKHVEDCYVQIVAHRKNKACHHCRQGRCREISRWDFAANGHLSTVWDWTLFSKMTIPPPPQRRVYQRLPPDFGSGEDEMAHLPSWPYPWSQKPVSGMFVGSAWAIMTNITLADLGQMLIEEQDVTMRRRVPGHWGCIKQLKYVLFLQT